MSSPRTTSEAPAPEARRASSTRTAGAGLVCAALALVLTASGLWATVAGVVSAAVGLGLGVAALVRSRGTGRRALLVAGAVAAIVLSTLALVTGAARLALWPVAEAYQECLSGTLTISGTAQCQQELEDGIWSYLSGSAASDGATGSPAASTSNASTERERTTATSSAASA